MYPKCFCCKVHPLMAEVERNPNIDVVCGATLQALDGEPGRFTATLARQPAWVDEAKCTACGKCAAACPHGAIGREDPRDIPAAYRLGSARCARTGGDDCRLCEAACPEGAINLSAKAGSQAVKVGAVVLATGLEQVDPKTYDTFGYGDIPGVVTSMEFERLLSPFGPTGGKLLRPGGEPARRVAWLQCVGSREHRRDAKPYCSSVCCMYALKQARCALEADPEAAGSIFYIDLRVHSRGGEEYLAQVQQAAGDRLALVRSRAHGLEPVEGGGVRIRYMDDSGKRRSEEFDLAVLSLGLCGGRSAAELAHALKLATVQGFARTPSLLPTATSRDGVYVCGGLHGPFDVHDSLLQASAAALGASSHLARAPRPKAPALAPNLEGEAACGVFICRCGGDVSRTVDVEVVREDALSLPGVAHAEVCESLCRDAEQEALVQAVREKGLNRLVVAGCSERVQGGLIRDLARRAGLSPYLLQQVNLREHCGLPHASEPEAATEQARDLVRMAVARVGAARHWAPEEVRFNQSVLVIGTRLSGLTAASRLLGRGLKVHLLDVGHRLRLRSVTGDGENVADYLGSLSRRMASLGVEMHQGRLTQLTGSAGDFHATIGEGKAAKRLRVGAIVVSTATEELRPDAYLLGQDGRVITLHDLDSDFYDRSPRVREIKQAAFIQCVGSRNVDNPRCSRVCCVRSVRGALRLKQTNPEAQVYVLYRDMRTYGLYELLYRQAREAGVNFIRVEEEPTLTRRREATRDVLELRATDSVIGQTVMIEPDLLVLATATLPSPVNAELAQALHVPLAADGFFAESAMKMRPAETDRPGIYISGGAAGPGMVRELLASAEAAACKAAGLLAQGRAELWPVRSEVDAANCDGCGYCVDPCAFGALKLIEFTEAGEVKKLAEVDAGLCAGCGVCQATCPKKGINVRGYDLDSLAAAVEAALQPR
jgi:heterodisulfide reductase subunit A